MFHTQFTGTPDFGQHYHVQNVSNFLGMGHERVGPIESLQETRLFEVCFPVRFPSQTFSNIYLNMDLSANRVVRVVRVVTPHAFGRPMHQTRGSVRKVRCPGHIQSRFHDTLDVNGTVASGVHTSLSSNFSCSCQYHPGK